MKFLFSIAEKEVNVYTINYLYFKIVFCLLSIYFIYTLCADFWIFVDV